MVAMYLRDQLQGLERAPDAVQGAAVPSGDLDLLGAEVNLIDHGLQAWARQLLRAAGMTDPLPVM